ncbi:hypothetical protein [Lysobacter sp. CA199]|uniref:hypothetical protein n=1 Tax=Lysobacter sp. CA199 TaxID=3455608 RepID=UPI003F8D2245
MRLAAKLLAFALAWSGCAVAAESYDFPAQPFNGGDDASWSVTLKRLGPGQVDVVWNTPQGRSPHLSIQSVAPRVDLGVNGVVQGQYGLAGTVYYLGKKRPMAVLIQAIDPKQYCRHQGQYANHVILVVYKNGVPWTLLYGCGVFAPAK